MPSYRRTDAELAHNAYLQDVYDWPDDPIFEGTHPTYTATPQLITFTNSDGSRTILFGTFIFGGPGGPLLGGTVTGITHADAGGTALEEWFGLSPAIGLQIFQTMNGEQLIESIRPQIVEIWGGASDDILAGADGVGVHFILGQGGHDDITLGSPGLHGARHHLDYLAFSDGVNGFGIDLDLVDGTMVTAGGDFSWVNNAHFNNVDVTLTEFSDHLVHNHNQGTIFAGAGDDVIVGLGGGDIINGWTGSDTIDYSWFPGPPAAGGGGTSIYTVGPLVVNLGLASSSYTMETRNFSGNVIATTPSGDTLTNIENVIGSSQNDRIIGSTAINVLSGGGGDDVLMSAGGDPLLADIIDGGSGTDTLSFEWILSNTATLTIESAAGHQGRVTRNPAGGGETGVEYFDNIEIILGGPLGNNIVMLGSFGISLIDALGGDDYVQGSNAAQTLRGGSGNDTLSGRDGNDTLDGGIGNDTATYAYSTLGWNFDFNTNQAIRLGGVDVDTLISIENVTLGSGNDTITLTSFGTSNTVDAGGGSDVVYLPYAFDGNYVVHTTLSMSGVLSLHIDGPAGNDTFINVENFVFADGIVRSQAELIPPPPLFDDYTNTTFTGGLVNTGFGSSGSIEARGDRDWFRAQLTAGDTYTFAVSGTTLANPILYLYDANGALLTSVDDSDGPDPILTFVATGTDQYFLGVGSSGDAATGTYVIGMTVVPASTALDESSNFIQVTQAGGSWFAGGGDDTVIGSSGLDLISGGAGFDNLYGGAGDDTLAGGLNEDVLVGDAGNDALSGGDGNDVLSELFDSLGSGNDTFDGGNGIDIMYAEAGNDAVSGGADANNNFASLGAGDDSYNGGAAVDVVVGGTGNDSINGNGGTDSLFGEDGHDTISGGADLDVLSGAAGNDTLDGGDGPDLLVGDAGNDTLRGGAGLDVIFGFADNDIVNGGPGVDALYGGAGHDMFQVGGTGYGSDLIWDFEANGTAGAPSDQLVFQAGHFADANAVRMASAFSGGNTVITVPGSNGATVTLVGVNIANILGEDILVGGVF